MIEGKYKLRLNTPMGEINGNLELKMQNREVYGVLDVMGGKSQFKGGKVEGNKFIFKGDFNTPLGLINYSLLGIVEGDKLDIYAETNKGRFKLEGTRIK